MMPDDELESDEFKAKLFALIDDASVREGMVAAARAQKTGEAAAALAMLWSASPRRADALQ